MAQSSSYTTVEQRVKFTGPVHTNLDLHLQYGFTEIKAKDNLRLQLRYLQNLIDIKKVFMTHTALKVSTALP